jgi:starch-binding outer membrane protein, SusD/RagB family
MKKIIFILVVFLTSTILFSCKKDYLETKSSNQVELSTLMSKINSVNAVMSGVTKAQFVFGSGGTSNHDDYGQKSIDLQMDLMGNDMVVHSAGYGWYNGIYNYTSWQLATSTSLSYKAWRFYYNEIITNCNTIINNVSNVSDATTTQKESIKGQALGLRAYAYYYLANLYQQTYKGNETRPGVPVNLLPETIGKPRGTVKDVYNQIVADLTQAELLLTGKTRASKVEVDLSVVQGLRARVALLMEDWPNAALYASKARVGYSLMTSSAYPAFNAFSDVTNTECMWGSLITSDQATIYASFYSHMDIRTGGYAALGGQKKITKSLYDLIPATDVRKTVFKTPGSGTTSNPDYNQMKLQVPVAGSWAADYSYMRVSEMYLMEAEGNARNGNEPAARTAIETLVKARYPAYSAASFSGVNLINEILLQRRIELWGEGFSLIDLKRNNQGLNRTTGAGNHGLPNFNPNVFTTSPMDPRFLMRIPQYELDNNPALTPGDQNP